MLAGLFRAATQKSGDFPLNFPLYRYLCRALGAMIRKTLSRST